MAKDSSAPKKLKKPIKRTEKKVSIVAKKYFVNGKHACANDFKEGGVCMFLRATHFGQVEVCSALNNMTINRADCDKGRLLPLKGCPIKKAKIIKNEKAEK